MKSFLEVTEIDGKMRVLCPIDKILSIVCDGDESVFIEMGVDRKGESTGVYVAESYDEIKEKILQSEV